MQVDPDQYHVVSVLGQDGQNAVPDEEVNQTPSSYTLIADA